MDLTKLSYKYPLSYSFYLKGKIKDLFYRNFSRTFIFLFIIAPIIVAIVFPQYRTIGFALIIMAIIVFEIFLIPLFKLTIAKNISKAEYIEWVIKRDKIEITVGETKSEINKKMIKKTKIYQEVIVFNINSLSQILVITNEKDTNKIKKDLESLDWKV